MSKSLDLYCADNGRASLDPEVAMRLEITGVVEGITKSRALLRQAQVNVAIRWFVGYRPHETLPDHSSLSVTPRRWGRERFRRLLERRFDSASMPAWLAARRCTWTRH